MLKKFLLIFLTFLLTQLNVFASALYIPKGTLVKVAAKAPITTQNLEEGTIVYFMATSDVWVQEEKAIEKGDVFQGVVNKITMPVLGVNASLGIGIIGIRKVNGQRCSLNGRIIFNSGDILGGNLTHPASYNVNLKPMKTYGYAWGGALQYVPSGDYEFGQHVRVDSHDRIFVQFDEDFYF